MKQNEQPAGANGATAGEFQAPARRHYSEPVITRRERLAEITAVSKSSAVSTDT